jgi:hypothetical protein
MLLSPLSFMVARGTWLRNEKMLSVTKARTIDENLGFSFMEGQTRIYPAALRFVGR